MTSLSDSDAPAPIGHNKPPEPTLLDHLAETYSLEIDRAEPIATLANNMPKKLVSADDKAAAGDIARDAADLAKALDKLREVEKAPFLKGGREVDGYFNPTVQRLDRISKGMLDRINTFNREERAKADRERAEAERQERERAAEARKVAEADAAAGRIDDAMAEMKEAAAADAAADQIAAAPPPQREDLKTTTDAGTSIGTRLIWTFEINDYAKIDLNVLKPYIKRDDVEKLIRKHVATHQNALPLAGVHIFQDEQATTRR